MYLSIYVNTWPDARQLYSLNPAGFHLQTEMMRRISKNSTDDVCCFSRYLYRRYSNNLFWGCLDSAVGRGDG